MQARLDNFETDLAGLALNSKSQHARINSHDSRIQKLMNRCDVYDKNFARVLSSGTTHASLEAASRKRVGVPLVPAGILERVELLEKCQHPVYVKDIGGLYSLIKEMRAECAGHAVDVDETSGRIMAKLQANIDRLVERKLDARLRDVQDAKGVKKAMAVQEAQNMGKEILREELVKQVRTEMKAAIKKEVDVNMAEKAKEQPCPGPIHPQPMIIGAAVSRAKSKKAKKAMGSAPTSVPTSAACAGAEAPSPPAITTSTGADSTGTNNDTPAPSTGDLSIDDIILHTAQVTASSVIALLEPQLGKKQSKQLKESMDDLIRPAVLSAMSKWNAQESRPDVEIQADATHSSSPYEESVQQSPNIPSVPTGQSESAGPVKDAQPGTPSQPTEEKTMLFQDASKGWGTWFGRAEKPAASPVIGDKIVEEKAAIAPGEETDSTTGITTSPSLPKPETILTAKGEPTDCAASTKIEAPTVDSLTAVWLNIVRAMNAHRDVSLAEIWKAGQAATTAIELYGSGSMTENCLEASFDSLQTKANRLAVQSDRLASLADQLETKVSRVDDRAAELQRMTDLLDEKADHLDSARLAFENRIIAMIRAGRGASEVS